MKGKDRGKREGKRNIVRDKSERESERQRLRERYRKISRERKNTMTAALVTLLCKSIPYPKIRHLSSATGFAGFSVLTVV